jgi:hypothetical protein
MKPIAIQVDVACWSMKLRTRRLALLVTGRSLRGGRFVCEAATEYLGFVVWTIVTHVVLGNIELNPVKVVFTLNSLYGLRVTANHAF